MLNITTNKLSSAKDIKLQLNKFINHIIKAKVRLQYIKIDLNITYIKDSEVKTDVPLAKDYLINIRSKYKKEQKYFIENMIKSYEKLVQSNEITTLLYMNISSSKVKRKDVEQFQIVKN